MTHDHSRRLLLPGSAAGRRLGQGKGRLAGAGLCAGQTVLNASFETGATPPFGGTYIPAPYSTAISGWTLQSASVDYVGNDTWPAADGNRSLDMSGHDAGTITQNISGFTPGHQYRLSFYMAGNNDGVARIFRLQAKISSVTETFSFDATGRTYSDMGWSLRTLNRLNMAITARRPEIKPSITKQKLEKDDIVLLCSDGLWGVIPESLIWAAANELPPEVAVKKLVDLANRSQGPDNISVIIARRIKSDRRIAPADLEDTNP